MTITQIGSIVQQPTIATHMTLRKRTKSGTVAAHTLQTTHEAPVKKIRSHKKMEQTSSSSAVGMQLLASQVTKQKSAKYQEMVCRLKPEEHKRLELWLSLLPKKEERSVELVTALQDPNYKQAIFTSPDWPFYALEALNKGLIDEYQFGTLQQYWSIGQYHGSYHDVKICSLFMPDGTDNPEAITLINSTMNGKIAASLARFAPSDIHTCFFTKDECDKFMQEMKKAPLSEQQFFIVPDLQKTNKTETISQTIQEYTGVNIFSRLTGDLRMVPSLTMMQTFLRVRFGDQAVKINPVLGLSTLEQIKKIDQRDMALHFPGTHLPKMADSYPAPWYDFAYHDFYHAVICSGIPTALRAKLIDIADFALEMMNESGFAPTSCEGQTLWSIRKTLIDMEATSFRKDWSLITISSTESRFWSELIAIFFKAFALPSYTKFDLDTAILFFQKVTKKLILDKEGEKYGLTLNSLELSVSAPTISNIATDFEIGSLNFGQFMLDAVTKPSSKVVINPYTRTIIDAEKCFLSIWQKQRKENVIFPQHTNVNQETERAAIASKEFGITFADWIQLEKDCSNDNVQLLALLLAKTSVKQILSLEPAKKQQIVQNGFLIATLLKSGASWEKICQPDTLATILKWGEIACLLLQMGASLDVIEKLPEDHRTLLIKNSYQLQKFADVGQSFELLTTLKLRKLELVIDASIVLNYFSLEAIQKMTPNRLKIITQVLSYSIPALIKKGISAEVFLTMRIDRLKMITQASYSICSLLDMGVSAEVLLALSNKQLHIVKSKYHEIYSLLKIGFTLDQILASETLRENYFEITQLKESGVTPETICTLKPERLKTLVTSESRELVQLQFPIDWVIEVGSTLEDSYTLEYFLNEGVSVKQLVALPKNQLSDLLKWSNKANNRTQYIKDWIASSRKL